MNTWDSIRAKKRLPWVLVVLAMFLAPRVQSQTPSCAMTVPHGCKPSDVFFSGPGVPVPSFGSNLKAGPSIVRKGVIVRGWLTKDPGPFSDAVYHNESAEGGVYLGLEDVHYNLVLDYDFITNLYGNNPSALTADVLPGDPVDSQTKPIPLVDSGNGTLTGIGINSFWLPFDTGPLILHTELNAWHQHGSHHCGALGQFCSAYRNYDPMGTPPAGWVEKEDSTPLSNLAADNWWPFDPDNPDGQATNLKPGDYVEISGTLWQDLAHDAPSFLQNLTGSAPPPPCWGQIFHSQDGYLEVHPVDYLIRLPAPGPSPYNFVFNSDPAVKAWVPVASLPAAQAGMKRVAKVMLCAGATGAAGPDSYPSYSAAVCPEADYPGMAIPPGRTPPQPLMVPHVLELIDGRFSTPQSIGHGAGVNNVNPDCVNIQAWLTGVPWARFKASYVMWWTLPPPNIVRIAPGAGSAVAQIGPASKLGAAVSTAPPSLSATVSTSGPATDTVTVTSGGTPVAGAAVNVVGQTAAALTDANGVAVITFVRPSSPCYAPGSIVPSVGKTTVPTRTPVPCPAVEGVVSKPGYQSVNIGL